MGRRGFFILSRGPCCVKRSGKNFHSAGASVFHSDATIRAVNALVLARPRTASIKGRDVHLFYRGALRQGSNPVLK